jgi:hypothetical protein
MDRAISPYLKKRAMPTCGPCRRVMDRERSSIKTGVLRATPMQARVSNFKDPASYMPTGALQNRGIVQRSMPSGALPLRDYHPARERDKPSGLVF